MRQSPKNRIQHVVETFADVFGQEPQDLVPILLQQDVARVCAACGTTR